MLKSQFIQNSVRLFRTLWSYSAFPKPSTTRCKVNWFPQSREYPCASHKQLADQLSLLIDSRMYTYPGVQWGANTWKRLSQAFLFGNALPIYFMFSVCNGMKVNTSLNTDLNMTLKCCWKWLVFCRRSHTSFSAHTPLTKPQCTLSIYVESKYKNWKVHELVKHQSYVLHILQFQ